MESIPYNPRLALGQIVDEDILENVEALAAAAVPTEVAQEKLNALILAKRSLLMTMDELSGLEIKTDELKESSEEISKEILDAAKQYAKEVISSTKTIIGLRTKGAAKDTKKSSVESPLDFGEGATAIRGLPLSANSLKLDAQYFSKDEVSAINDYVSSKTEFLGPGRSSELASAATKQTSSQYQNHDIEGTLVITATCTHKVADLLSPCVIDPDNAVEAWNAKFPGNKFKLEDMAHLEVGDSGPALSIISGVSYGSSFVGMVHMLQRSTSLVDDKKKNSVEALAEKASPLLELSNWVASKSGDLEISKSLAKAAQNMMSTSRVDCHCSIVCMGVVPSLTPGTVKHMVKEIAGNEAGREETSGSDSPETLASEGEKGRAMLRRLSTQVMKAGGLMSKLSDMQGEQTKVLDVGTMMTALEDYMQQITDASTTSIGVPINYYIKRIGKAQVARVWRKKYYPESERTTTKE